MTETPCPFCGKLIPYENLEAHAIQCEEVNGPELERIFQQDHIRDLGDDLYEVPSAKIRGKVYVVDLKDKSCSCPHFTYRGAYCKHIKAVEASKRKPYKSVYYRYPDILNGDDSPLSRW